MLNKGQLRRWPRTKMEEIDLDKWWIGRKDNPYNPYDGYMLQSQNTTTYIYDKQSE